MTGITDGILKVKEPYSVYGLMLGISLRTARVWRTAQRQDELDAARAGFLKAAAGDHRDRKLVDCSADLRFCCTDRKKT